jgi:hypothetical protein
MRGTSITYDVVAAKVPLTLKLFTIIILPALLLAHDKLTIKAFKWLWCALVLRDHSDVVPAKHW